MLLLLTAAARLIYDMARKGSLPRSLSTVSRRSRAPWAATIAAGIVAGVFAWSGQLGLVAAVTDFSVYAVFLAVNLAVLRLRRLMPDAHRSMRAGPSIAGYPVAPALGLVATVVMLAFLEPTAWAVGLGLIGLAVVVWFALRLRPRGG